MPEKIRVLIADDIAATRENICMLIEFDHNMVVIGQAASGHEAVVQVRDLRPDVILMDINMPGMDGIAATERITGIFPDSSVIIMSVQGEEEYLNRAKLAGAKDYLVKPFSGDELLQAIKQSLVKEYQDE